MDNFNFYQQMQYVPSLVALNLGPLSRGLNGFIITARPPTTIRPMGLFRGIVQMTK